MESHILNMTRETLQKLLSLLYNRCVSSELKAILNQSTKVQTEFREVYSNHFHKRFEAYLQNAGEKKKEKDLLLVEGLKLLQHRMGAVTPEDYAGKPDYCLWKDKFLFLFLKYYLFLHSTKSAFAPLYWTDGGDFLEESSKSNISVYSNFDVVGFSTERVAEKKCCVEPRRCATPCAKVLRPKSTRRPSALLSGQLQSGALVDLCLAWQQRRVWSWGSTESLMCWER